ncbi:Putative thiol-disulphide oxidoreductase DCC [Prunus dulcis]|uniref:Thiol-disulphide oxidoreductase DCC n=1 Tax=Prunus dulcis TaxID=3755 RepID=A0A4Y1QQK4_PRUDU|nr:Putative thiol-disulphide oxidoreductase DCC [Prunus dulcis]
MGSAISAMEARGYTTKALLMLDLPVTTALKVLSYLPLPYSALSAFRVTPTPLREIVYDYVAKRRYDIFGKSEDCLVLQEKELLERFIDREEIMYRARPDF